TLLAGGDDIGEPSDGVPSSLVFAVELYQFPREAARLLHAVDDDLRAARENVRRDLRARWYDGADGVDVRAAREHCGREKRLPRAGDRSHDGRLAYGVGNGLRSECVDAELGTHAIDQPLPPIGVAAEDAHSS